MQNSPVPPLPTWFFDSDWGVFWQIFGAIGALALALTALAAAVAIAVRQFKLMHDQGEVIGRQTTLLEEHRGLLGRIEGIEAEQKAILHRQSEIIEGQYRFLQAQWSRRSKLFLRASGQHRDGQSTEFEDVTSVTFEVQNFGDKTADGFYWEILFGPYWDHFAKAVDENGKEIKKKWAHLSETESFKKIYGHYRHKLFPRSTVEVAWVDVNVIGKPMQEFALKWRIACEDEIIPEEGFTLIHFRLADDRFYAVTHDNPRPVVDTEPQAAS